MRGPIPVEFIDPKERRHKPIAREVSPDPVGNRAQRRAWTKLAKKGKAQS